MDAHIARDELGKRIAEAFGIKHCKSIVIRMGVNDVSTVTAEFHPMVDGVRQMEAVLRDYKLTVEEREWI